MSTFNRVQENVTKGFKTRVGEYGNRHNVSARAIRGIGQDVQLNRALWTLGQRMAEIRAGK